jgi:O-antigen/teichoic acid export membrane protein
LATEANDLLSAQRLVSGRVLARSTLWSLLGIVIPAVAALVAIPPIVHGFGDERFGVLALAWVVIGYFSFFDLGLGRAITRKVAELLAGGEHDGLRQAIWTSWYMMLGLGVIGAALAAALVPIVVMHAVPVSSALRAETLTSFYLLALGVPAVVLTAGVRGVLEATQRFDLVNAVRVPMGLLTFGVPLATLQFTPELPPAILGLVVVRLATLLAYAILCLRTIPGLGRADGVSRAVSRELLASGSWMTVSNVISPIMVTFDRFFVSALISVAAVTYYATPYEAATKAIFIPGAVCSVLFPAFSVASASDRMRLARLFRTGVRTIFLAQIPLAFVVVCFAPELLRWWLGPAFEAQSTSVLRWLMVGVLVNSLAYPPFNLLQSVNRADLTAKLHLVELPLYLGTLVALIHAFGIEGAAIAWCLRVTVDAVALYWLAARVQRGSVRDLIPTGAAPALLLLLLGVSVLVSTPTQKLLTSVFFAATFGAAVWWWGLDSPLRAGARTLVRRYAHARERTNIP